MRVPAILYSSQQLIPKQARARARARARGDSTRGDLYSLRVPCPLSRFHALGGCLPSSLLDELAHRVTGATRRSMPPRSTSRDCVDDPAAPFSASHQLASSRRPRLGPTPDASSVGGRDCTLGRRNGRYRHPAGVQVAPGGLVEMRSSHPGAAAPEQGGVTKSLEGSRLRLVRALSICGSALKASGRRTPTATIPPFIRCRRRPLPVVDRARALSSPRPPCSFRSLRWS